MDIGVLYFILPLKKDIFTKLSVSKKLCISFLDVDADRHSNMLDSSLIE